MQKLLTPSLLVLGLLSAPWAVAQPAKEAPKKGLSLGKVAESQKDPVREKLDAALRLLRSEQYAEAAVALQDFLESEKQHAEEAQYNLGKSLYRMGLYHSALGQFADLLAKGPKSRFFDSSLEWCLFISRKTVASDLVNEVIAKNSTGEFPKDYRDEFLFRLARFHYVRALAIESGAIAGQVGETRVKETVTGGKSFEGDIFSGGGGGGGGEEGEGENPGDPKVKKGDGGGLSIDEDIFGDAPKKDDKKKKEEKPKEKPVIEVPKDEGDAKKGKPGEKFALTAKEHLEAATKFVTKVAPESAFGPRGKFLEGLVLYRDGKENEALESFKTVVRLTKESTDGEGEALREAAFFQLARTHFGAQQPSFSIFYYGKVDRDSYAWLDALYEASWAQFRLGAYEKALGNLLTLHSPFFTDQYYPESLILKAVIYYENCRYPEAKEILADFLKRYEPVLEALNGLTNQQKTSAQYYEALENLRGSDLAETNTSKAAILAQVLEIALSDPELKRLDLSFKEVDAELKSLPSQGAGFPSSKLAKKLEDQLAKVREALLKDAGRAVKNQLERERENIKLLVQQAIRIDIETSRSEQERIEGQLRSESSRPNETEKEFIEWADDEKLVWPFEGEYWRDELGTYELTLAHSCR
jgi:TolA-binding protein